MKIINYGILIFILIITQTICAQSLKSVSPSEISAKIGDTFEAFVSAENVTDLFGASFNYHFNKKYVELKSVTNESFFGNDVVSYPNIDNSNGVVSVGISRKAGQNNSNGSGNIIKATFEIINLPQQDSTIDFTISDITASDSLGISVSLNSISSITVLKLPQLQLNKTYPISPQTINGVIGNEFDTQIYIEDVKDLFGISFSYNYSKKILEVLSVQLDTLMGNDVVFYPNIDNANGVVGIGVAKKSGQENFTGSGILLTIKSKIISLPLQDSTITFSITDLTGIDKDGNSLNLSDSTSVSLIDVTTDIDEIFEVIPKEYSLNQNYPNPFNPTTVISYSIPKQSQVSLRVYDVLGNLIEELLNDEHSAGNYKVNFNANNLSSGIYFYKIQAGTYSNIKKMLLLR